MSGGDACAIVAPSTNSTMECTIDCGWTTTSIASNGTSNSRCASMTSSPLFTSVAELVVTIRPMSQVGCASASSGRTSGEARTAPAAERPSGGGEHEAADLAVRAGGEALGDRGVLAVDRRDPAGRHERLDDRRRR